MTDQIKPSHPSEETTPATNSREVHWIGLLLFVLISSATVAGVEARTYYNKLEGLQMTDASNYDVVLMCWSLWAKTLILLLPVLLVSTLCLMLKWKKTASSIIFSGTLFVLIWMMVDLRLQRFTGGHITNYLENIFNPATWGWGGDLSRIYWQMTWDVVATVSGGIGLFWLCNMIHRNIAAHLKTFPQRHHFAGLVSLTAIIIAGPFPALQFVDDALVIERLYAAMPSYAWVFTPENVPNGGTAAFTIQADDAYVELGQVAHSVSTQSVPIDTSIIIPESNRPNVVIFIVESFRSNTICNETMPRLTAFGKQGTVLKQHFAASNKSDLGTFALLYGRSPLAYDATLDAKIPQQACALFKNSQYRTSLVGSCSFHQGRMNQFMDDKQFESIIIHKDRKEKWWKRDRENLIEVKQIITSTPNQPQFVVSYLMSTHFSYDYPPEYDQKNHTEFNPTKKDKDRGSLDRKNLLNRYNNALAYMDDELGQLVESIDLKKNIVIITGDHGESMMEDGHITHGTALSDAQTHVPMLIVGAGIPQTELNVPTSHIDFLPSLLHKLTGRENSIKNLHGSSFYGKDHRPHAFLVQWYHDSWDLMLVRSDGRLKMNLRRNKPILRLIGFSNDIGHASRKLAHPPREILQWKRNLATALRNYRIKPSNYETTKRHKLGQQIQ